MESCIDGDVCESNTQCISNVCSCPAETVWDDILSVCVYTSGGGMSNVLSLWSSVDKLYLYIHYYSALV